MEQIYIEDRYSLSPMQQGMLFHYLSNMGSPGDYIEQLICDLREELDPHLFKLGLEKIFDRHPVFRTSFQWENEGEPMHLVHSRVILPYTYIDLKNFSAAEKDKKVNEYITWDRNEGFNLKEAPLFRLCLFRLENDYYKFILTHHHILMDGRSFMIIFKELFLFYEAFDNNQEIEIETPRPYKDYINWFYQQDFSKAELYWKGLLDGFNAPTPLINLNLQPPKDSKIKEHGEIEFRLSVDETSSLAALASQNGANLNTLIQLAWAIILSRYSGEQDVVFGVVRGCRRLPLDGLDSMVGLFLNNLPIRVHLSEEMKVDNLLKELRAQLVSQREFDHTPLAKVQEWAGVSLGGILFESYIVYDHKEPSSYFQLEGGAWKNRSYVVHEQTNYPIVLTVFGEKEFLVEISYDQNRFDHETINRMASHLKTLLKGISKNYDYNLSEFDILAEYEKDKIILEWNRTDEAYRKNVCLHELFEEQADRTPGEIALSYKGQDLTYKELDQRANQLARHLREKGIGPDSLVGVFMERSFEMVIALYGILKAGGAYVPLDPEYPKERLTFMIEDTKIHVILAQKHLVNDLPQHDTEVLCLDSDWEKISEYSIEKLENKITENNLAYVIFTSGSTGKPKGVMNEHRGICNRLFWMQDAYKLGKEDRILQKTPFSFDVSVWEFFWPLLFGARLVIAPPGAHKDTNALVNVIRDNKITTIHFVPSMLQLFLEDKEVGKCKSLKRVICSGEALHYDLKERFFERINNAELHNLYGPTEAAVDVTYWECKRGDGLNTVPIGRPIANTRIYILDTQMRPVPIGVPGELYIGGIQVARGYISRPELTKERFIPDPFSMTSGARLYKTGDLCRYLPNGAIDFLGRMDFQVKIRGLRIELGEIESILSQHPQVREAVVTALRDEYGSDRLVGYFIPSKGETPKVETLRSFLEEKLPDYMVPEIFIMLDSFPLTSSGKTDRKALPKPDTSRPELEQSFVPPSNDIERKLVDIWRRILNIDKVGIHDKFFSLGGNSLRIIQTIAKIKEILNFEMPAAKMLQYPTISLLAKYIESDKTGDQGFYAKVQKRAKLRKAAISQRKRAKRR